jgi:hypothetical protein
LDLQPDEGVRAYRYSDGDRRVFTAIYGKDDGVRWDPGSWQFEVSRNGVYLALHDDKEYYIPIVSEGEEIKDGGVKFDSSLEGVEDTMSIRVRGWAACEPSEA